VGKDWGVFSEGVEVRVMAVANRRSEGCWNREVFSPEGAAVNSQGASAYPFQGGSGRFHSSSTRAVDRWAPRRVRRTIGGVLRAAWGLPILLPADPARRPPAGNRPTPWPSSAATAPGRSPGRRSATRRTPRRTRRPGSSSTTPVRPPPGPGLPPAPPGPGPRRCTPRPPGRTRTGRPEEYPRVLTSHRRAVVNS